MKSKSGTQAWLVTLAATLFFFYEFIQLSFPNAIDGELMRAFHLDAPGLGLLVSLYFWANTLFLLPAGILFDRFSTKKIILIGMAVCVVGTFVFAVTASPVVAGIARFGVGGAAAFCFLSCMLLAARWFPPHRLALVTGVVITVAMLGGFVAQSPMVLLTHYLGWRNAMLLNGMLGVVLLIVMVLFIHDYPPGCEEDLNSRAVPATPVSLGICLRHVLSNRNNWLGGLYTSLLNLPVFLFGGLWGMHYLTQVHHVTPVQASYATSMLFVGVIVGSPLFGWISDFMRRRCLPMIIGAILSLVVMLALMYVPHLSLTALLTLFFALGLVTSSQVLSYPAIAELNPIAFTGTALSVASIIIMLGGVIFPPAFGWLLAANWDHTVINGMPIYSTHAFVVAMWIMPVAFAVGLGLAFLLQETHCKSQA